MRRTTRRVGRSDVEVARSRTSDPRLIRRVFVRGAALRRRRSSTVLSHGRALGISPIHNVGEDFADL